MLVRFGQPFRKGNAMDAMKTVMPVILASALITACAPKSSVTNQVQFSEPNDTRVSSKLSPSQESESVLAARYLSQVIELSGTGVAHSDALLFANLLTSNLETQTGGLDSVLTDELEKCVRRKVERVEGSTSTAQVWYDNAEGHACPIYFKAVETTSSGSLGKDKENVGTRSVSITFAAKEMTRQYEEGKIRSLSLTHTESFSSLSTPREPGARGHRTLTQSVSGSLQFTDTSSVTFLIDHKIDVAMTRVDDSTENSSGRDLLRIQLAMPFGTHEVAYDARYTPYSQTPKTRIVINGVDTSKKTTGN